MENSFFKKPVTELVYRLFVPHTIISVASEIEKGLLDGTISLTQKEEKITKDSFFKETAEDMIDTLIAKNTFPIINSTLRSTLIKSLNSHDDILKSLTDTDTNNVDSLCKKFNINLPKKNTLKNIQKENYENLRTIFILKIYINLVLSCNTSQNNRQPST